MAEWCDNVAQDVVCDKVLFAVREKELNLWEIVYIGQ